MANIAEGFERRGPRDFARFLLIAKASNGELLSHLYLARDIGFIPPEEFARLSRQTEEVGRLLGSLRRSVLHRAEPRAHRASHEP